jgi:hypothetical protein
MVIGPAFVGDAALLTNLHRILVPRRNDWQPSRCNSIGKVSRKAGICFHIMKTSFHIAELSAEMAKAEAYWASASKPTSFWF